MLRILRVGEQPPRKRNYVQAEPEGVLAAGRARELAAVSSQPEPASVWRRPPLEGCAYGRAVPSLDPARGAGGRHVEPLTSRSRRASADSMAAPNFAQACFVSSA